MRGPGACLCLGCVLQAVGQSVASHTWVPCSVRRPFLLKHEDHMAGLVSTGICSPSFSRTASLATSATTGLERAGAL